MDDRLIVKSFEMIEQIIKSNTVKQVIIIQRAGGAGWL